MRKVVVAPADQPFDAVLIERKRMEQEANPDIEMYDHVLLKQGPRAYKTAVHWVIRDRNTGEIHHHVVKIETYRKTKGGWMWDEQYSITLDDQDKDEIRPLASFLCSVLGTDMPKDEGTFFVVPVTEAGADDAAVRQLINGISTSGKADVIADLFAAVKGDADLLRMLMEQAKADPDRSREAAAILNLARFENALEMLEALIAMNAREKEFQAHLEQHPWMFGSEYSELVDRRRWTRDEQQDFVLRCTVDGYLEVIEIKTPLNGEPLFRYDPSHQSYFPRAELSEVLGQVMHYLELIDASSYEIKARDGENVQKIRAKIIIGSDGDAKQAAAQTAALRRFNGHLHRIEVLTFDQLVRIAHRVVGYLQEIVAPIPHAEIAETDR